MSQENVEIVRSLYDALNRRDWDGVFRDAHPDFYMTTQRGPNAGPHRRREEAEGFLKDYIAAFDRIVWEPEEFFESGDHVVVVLTTRSRPKRGSVDMVTRNGHLWTVRDDTILSINTFPDPNKALEAVGLSQDAHADS
jgi:ketosteroid isomerase-like protein